MTYTTILYTQKESIITVTLNRPEVRNALNKPMIEELIDCFTKIHKNETCKTVILQGKGKLFCSGADINWMKESLTLTPTENEEDSRKLYTLFNLINTCPMPVIGNIHGAAIGGGIGLVATCDIIITEPDTIFSLSEVKIGLIPSIIGPFVQDKIGPSWCRALFLSAERFNGKKALEIGLAHELHTNNSDRETRLKTLLDSIKTGSPNAIKTAKTYLNTLPALTKEEQVNYSIKTLADLRITEETQEGLKAFLEKRPPNWLKKDV